MKTPSLRNVSETGPWFTEGVDPKLAKIRTVEDAVAAYHNPPYHEVNPHLHPAIRDFLEPNDELDAATVADITAFLVQGLLDPRVQARSAPFDHPPIWVPLEAAVDECGRTEDPEHFKSVLPRD